LISRSFPLLPFAVLIVLAALTFWLSQLTQTNAANASGKARNDPDMIIEKFSAQKLSETGDVQYRLNADKMTHLPATDTALLDTVEFKAATPGKPTVTARAPRGSSLRGGEEVILEGGVTLNSTASGNIAAAVFTTPKLTLLPDAQIARSVDGVVAESAMGTITAQKFEFNNETGVAIFERGKMKISRRNGRIATPAATPTATQ
jgi:lipopolysaccharide export system protein LptC